MATAVEIASAYINLSTKMPGVKKDVERALGEADEVAEKSGKKWGKGLAVGLAAGTGLVAAAAAGMASKVIQSFGELEQNLGGSEAVFGKYAKSVQKTGQEAYKNLGISQSEYLATANKMGALFQGSGVKQADSLKMTTDAMQRAADMASVMGIDMNMAMESVAGAAKGNYTMMDNLGVAMNQTAIEAYAAANGMEDFSFKSASSAEKADVAMRMFMDSTKQYAGNFAREATETVSGSFGMLSASWEELLAGFGNKDADMGRLTQNLANAVGAVAKNVAPIVGNIFSSLPQAIGSFLSGMGPAIDGFLRDLDIEPLTAFLDTVKGAITWVQNNLTWLGPLAASVAGVAAAWGLWNGAIAVWQTATKIGTALQVAFNAVMAANPIMLVVTAVAALVAGLTYFFTQTELGKQIWSEFTGFLIEAWANISGFFVEAWENVLQPTLKAFADAGMWLYNNALKPAFDGIAAAVTVAGGVVKVAIDVIVNLFRILGAVGVWLWRNAIKPALDAIGAAFTWLLSRTVRPVVDGISGGIRALGAVFTWLNTNIVQPVWNGIKTAINTAATWINNSVFTPFKKNINTIATSFKTAKDAVTKTWNGIKTAAATPINFVLDTVWNNGLRSFWNDVVTNLGLKDMKLAKAPLIKMASGGVLPGYTPGRDVHDFFSPTGGRLSLSGGEAIMRPEFTRAVGGPAGVDRLNRMARNGQAFKDGGTWDPLGDLGNFAGDVWNNITNAASVVGDFLADPVKAIQKHVVEGIIRPLIGDGNIFLKTVGQLPINLVKNLASKFMGGGDSKGTKGMGWRAMQDIILSNIPGARITSAYRSPLSNKAVGGAKASYHMLGRAVDIVPASMATFNAVKRLFPNASELIYTPAGAGQLLNGRSHANWSPAVRRQHYNHVHLAMAQGGVVPKLYDQGGWLPHGGMAVNRSGKPEAVLTHDESRALKSSLQSGTHLVLRVGEREFDAYVEEIADGRVANAAPTRGEMYSRVGRL